MNLDRNTPIEFLNLTPHDVNVLDENNEVIVTFVSIAHPEFPVRLPVNTEDLGYFDVGPARVFEGETQVNLVRNTYGQIENLPEPRPNTLFIVSSVVHAHSERADLVVPSPLVRDDTGRVIGCEGFAL